MKKLKANVVVAILFQCATIMYGFILPRFLIAEYGSEVYGLTQSIKQFLGLISFLDMGVGQVVRSELYKPLAEQNFSKISSIMVAGGRFYKTLACILLGYIGILFVFYPRLVKGTFGWFFVVTLLVAMSISSFMQYYFGIINEQLLHADQRSYIINGIHIICILINLLLCILMIRLRLPIQIIMLTTAVVFLAKPIFYVIYIRKYYHINRKASYDKNAISQKWNGITQHISAVVLDGTDHVVLTIFSSLTNVSVYSIYCMVIGSIQGFYQTVAVGIQSAAGAVWANNDFEKIKKMFYEVEFYLHTITLFLFSCVGVLIVPFVQVYTEGVTDGNYIQPLFALMFTIAYGIRCLRTPYNIWILAAGHFKQTQRCHVVAATLNLIISITAVFKWGLIGVAVGTLIAMCYQTLWLTIYTAKKLVECPATHILKRYVVDFIVFGVVYFITSGITLQEVTYIGWFVMAIKVALIAIVVIVVITGIFYKNECTRLIKSVFCKSA